MGMLPLIFAHYPPQPGLYQASQYTQMNKQGNAYISPNTTISANRQFTILRWILLYSRGFLRETPEGPPIVLRSRYTYIIILFDCNIISIIFPRLLVFPTDVLWFGENPVAFGEDPVTFFWPSCGLPVPSSQYPPSLALLVQEKPNL